MAVTKVLQIKTENNLKAALCYIKNEKKTQHLNSTDHKNMTGDIQDNAAMGLFDDSLFTYSGHGKHLVSCHGVMSVEHAYEEMMLTKKHAIQFLGERQSGKVDVLAHHIIQSFSPEDNLTPEQVHEIGRRTILELTGGQHEFVIATHMDKDHLHNHIIFNTTNSVTLRKFRWTKGTKKSLENISDKHADWFGAYIIDRAAQRRKRDYYVKRKSSYRYEIKERLTFLLRHSVSWEDFQAKAEALSLELKVTPNDISYRLKDTDQVKYIRASTLSKHDWYQKEGIEERIEDNESELTVETILEAYIDYKNEKEKEFEMRFIVENWQVAKETDQGLYLQVDFGIKNTGTVVISPYKYDALSDGSYEFFIKRNDFFYFVNPEDAEKNRLIKGITLARQLSADNRKNVIVKNYHVNRLNTLIEEFSYLSAKGVSDGRHFNQLRDSFNKQFHDTKKELDKLDERIAKLNKLYSVLLSDNPLIQQSILDEAVKDYGTSNKHDIHKLLQEVIIEREILRETFDKVADEYDQLTMIYEHVKERDDISPYKVRL
ncbi:MULTISPECIES: relaxase/mobilization nuclease domain-containing protein [unclassified Granulicatella]|uniref:helical hairpin domain-containing protein n=1 Tax=unclassified Granulicatella TaxID=2630493 RepID=UPI0010735F59|nr:MULTISPECIES: relaxase/mobilization nuclease domain-containing protein [unclassified Granulicatella]MBF0780080.1 relaxase/mobilization nuclease domain-containing protein [Granulicatella sp. 19428wC4_WM01]TFU95862.1 relaxase [Granulicatella sp. WM01]